MYDMPIFGDICEKCGHVHWDNCRIMGDPFPQCGRVTKSNNSMGWSFCVCHGTHDLEYWMVGLKLE